ncbi:unnamed protein product [Cladocopium goreaui]|uniref:C2H2-type domain-containing protein n=1 Tax=Cladocopium goreaui TaxID=2562237 RepID=A0A9P1CLU5_9DINO|nr:unnamed protein product [Cladocopium goreaui]
MEPLTLTKEPVVEKDAMEESTDFYRGMAEELSSLAPLSAEIQWAPDVPLRAKRTVAVPRVAATGRLPRPEPREPRAAPRRVPEWPREPREPREPPPVARDVTEVSTKRPPHLAIHTRPVRTAARRGLQTPQGRRLRLGAKAAKPSKESAGTEVELSHEEKTIEATAMPVAVPSVPPVPPPAAGPELVSRAVSVQEDLLSRPETYGESALSDVYEAAFREDPPIPRPQVQLLEVLDLQLFLPARTVTATPAEVFQVFQARESHLPQREISEDEFTKCSKMSLLRDGTQSPRSRRPREQRQAHGPKKMAIKMATELILDVIDEMSKPTAYQEPAEVVGGSELAPLFTSEARRSMPLDEDTYGRRLGRIPPPYEVGPPPPYDGLGPAVTEAEEQLRKTLQKKQEQLESKEKALAASQAEAQAQVKHLADLQQKVQEQSLALAQAQATLQAQVHSQREETNHLIQTVQQHSEAAQHSLAEAAQRGLHEMQERLAAGLASRDSDSDSNPLHQRLGRLEALLEGRFSETLKAMTSQSEVRPQLFISH